LADEILRVAGRG